jgi:midasin (ATPase involved in ribosome maturation)
LFYLARTAREVAKTTKWAAKGGVWLFDDLWTLRMLIALEKLSDIASRTTEKIEDEITKRLSKIRDKNSALSNIIEIQQLLVNDFLSREPLADLLKKAETEQ